jgi:hypothetical protein
MIPQASMARWVQKMELSNNMTQWNLVQVPHINKGIKCRKNSELMHNLSPEAQHTHLPDDMMSVPSLVPGKHASHFFSFCKVVATYRKISSVT